MQIESARARAMNDTRDRILDVALEVLGENPEAGMGDIASAAGVVRRTVYGHFPTRSDLVRTLAQRAVGEIEAVLTEVTGAEVSGAVVTGAEVTGAAVNGVEVAGAEATADQEWVDFVARLWPLAHRYRVLLALRRGEYGDEIHSLLGSVDRALAALVQRGQNSGVFARHLPAGILSQVAYATVFSIADSDRSQGNLGARAATMASLLLLGVPESRATTLLDARP
ncbi:TetR/AcrR family transcriptional regulator [Subtercola sp. YIM 133946]|uniref:TetR/AcrR family transcriptional regulator n=1 Tax=Subtercola sp. YIM 133946 TaxID=3118909 RepID=UPI002F94C207